MYILRWYLHLASSLPFARSSQTTAPYMHTGQTVGQTDIQMMYMVMIDMLPAAQISLCAVCVIFARDLCFTCVWGRACSCPSVSCPSVSASPTRGIITNDFSSNADIDLISIQSKGNAIEFGKDMYYGGYGANGGASTGTRGVWMGGYASDNPKSPSQNLLLESIDNAQKSL